MRVAGAYGATTSPVGWVSTTICVSGYAPVIAWRVESSALALSVSGPIDGIRATFTAFIEPQKQPRYVCGACNRNHGSKPFTDGRLGFIGYCAKCVSKLASRCGRKHGRLPVQGEFYCMKCEDIVTTDLMVKPDSNGRRRWRCVPCRRKQWAKKA